MRALVHRRRPDTTDGQQEAAQKSVSCPVRHCKHICAYCLGVCRVVLAYKEVKLQGSRGVAIRLEVLGCGFWVPAGFRASERIVSGSSSYL